MILVGPIGIGLGTKEISLGDGGTGNGVVGERGKVAGGLKFMHQLDTSNSMRVNMVAPVCKDRTGGEFSRQIPINKVKRRGR